MDKIITYRSKEDQQIFDAEQAIGKLDQEIIDADLDSLKRIVVRAERHFALIKLREMYVNRMQNRIYRQVMDAERYSVS